MSKKLKGAEGGKKAVANGRIGPNDDLYALVSVTSVFRFRPVRLRSQGDLA